MRAGYVIKKSNLFATLYHKVLKLDGNKGLPMMFILAAILVFPIDAVFEAITNPGLANAVPV